LRPVHGVCILYGSLLGCQTSICACFEP
jgi:hypothetical protein